MEYLSCTVSCSLCRENNISLIKNPDNDIIIHCEYTKNIYISYIHIVKSIKMLLTFDNLVNVYLAFKTTLSESEVLLINNSLIKSKFIIIKTFYNNNYLITKYEPFYHSNSSTCLNTFSKKNTQPGFNIMSTRIRLTDDQRQMIINEDISLIKDKINIFNQFSKKIKSTLVFDLRNIDFKNEAILIPHLFFIETDEKVDFNKELKVNIIYHEKMIKISAFIIYGTAISFHETDEFFISLIKKNTSIDTLTSNYFYFTEYYHSMYDTEVITIDDDEIIPKKVKSKKRALENPIVATAAAASIEPAAAAPIVQAAAASIAPAVPIVPYSKYIENASDDELDDMYSDDKNDSDYNDKEKISYRAPKKIRKTNISGYNLFIKDKMKERGEDKLDMREYIRKYALEWNKLSIYDRNIYKIKAKSIAIFNKTD